MAPPWILMLSVAHIAIMRRRGQAVWKTEEQMEADCAAEYEEHCKESEQQDYKAWMSEAVRKQQLETERALRAATEEAVEHIKRQVNGEQRAKQSRKMVGMSDS